MSMTPNQYQQSALKTESTPTLNFNGATAAAFRDMTRAAIEIGNVQDAIKKHVIYGKAIDDDKFQDAAGATIEALMDTALGCYAPAQNISLDIPQSRLVHGMVGIVTEAGELQDMVRKHVIDGAVFDRTNLLEELGDVMWYVALAADAYGLQLEDVMTRNIEKLKARYGDKFTQAAALNRDIATEKSILEGRDLRHSSGN